MRILITGGYGTLGTALAKELIDRGKLRESPHDLLIVDPQGDVSDAVRAEIFHTHGEYAGTHAGALAHILNQNGKVDVVVHLGEHLSVRDPIDPDVFIVNVAETAYVMKTCAQRNIHCIVGLWSHKPVIQNPLIASLHQKAQLIPFYNIGNAAIRGVQIPHLIDLSLPGSNLMSILSRVYNGVTGLQSPVIQEFENVDMPTQWGHTPHVVRELADIIEGTRGRQIKTIDGDQATVRQVVNTLLAIIGVSGHVVIRPKSPPILFEGTNEQIQDSIKIAIKAEIRAAEQTSFDGQNRPD
jgi:hypothetical protein